MRTSTISNFNLLLLFSMKTLKLISKERYATFLEIKNCTRRFSIESNDIAFIDLIEQDNKEYLDIVVHTDSMHIFEVPTEKHKIADIKAAILDNFGIVRVYNYTELR